MQYAEQVLNLLSSDYWLWTMKQEQHVNHFTIFVPIFSLPHNPKGFSRKLIYDLRRGRKRQDIGTSWLETR